MIPTGETVLFFREEQGKKFFYPIQLSGVVPTDKECADHANLNPEIYKITTLDGDTLWTKGTLQ